MPVTTFDGLIGRISAGYSLGQPIWGELRTATVSPAGANINVQRVGWTKALPNPLPTGVSAYIPTMISIESSTSFVAILVGKLIDLGSIDIAVGSLSGGTNMGTATELGNSNNLASALIGEVTTALNATPGSITPTYVDQDGNTAEAAAAVALGASAPIGSAFFVPLNGSDWGVRDITACSQSGGTTPTGVVQFWGMIPLGILVCNVVSAGGFKNLLNQDFIPLRLGAGDTIGAFCLVGTATKAIAGQIYFVGDST